MALDARKLRDSCIIKRPNKIKMDEIFNQILSELSKKRARPNLDISNRLGLYLWTNDISTGNKQALQFCYYGRKIERILPILEGILRASRHADHLSRKDTSNSRQPNTGMVGRYNSRDTRYERTDTQNLDTVQTKFENEGYKASKKVKILPEKNSVAGTHHLRRWNQTKQRKNRRNQQIEYTDK